jgi:trimeric autotransporter adhesin
MWNLRPAIPGTLASALVLAAASSDWSGIQEAYLKASNTGAADQFGRSVAVSDDTVVVGAFSEDSSATGVNGDTSNNSASSAGAVYVFVRNGSTWSQQAYLKASNTEANDLFGHAVAISGETIVVGAFMEDKLEMLWSRGSH